MNPIEWKVRSGLRASDPLDGPRRVGARRRRHRDRGRRRRRRIPRRRRRRASSARRGAYATEIVGRRRARRPRPAAERERGRGRGPRHPRRHRLPGAALARRRPGRHAAGARRLGLGRPGGDPVRGAVGCDGHRHGVRAPGRPGARARRDPRRLRRGLADRVRAAAPQGVTVALDAAGTDEAIQASLDLVEDRDRIATLVRGRDAASFGIRAFSGGSPTPLTAAAAGVARARRCRSPSR